MTMLFPYTLFKPPQPVVSLGGRQQRPRPIISVAVIGPSDTEVESALLDTGADDTVFPEDVAMDIGIDLTNAPVGHASGVATGTASLRYAEVTLRITDGVEQCEWRAWVGFTTLPLKRPLLGFAGFLQFFTATFHGDREVVDLTTNSLYPGT